MFTKLNNNSEKLKSLVTEKRAPIGDHLAIGLFENWERTPKRLERIEEALGGDYSIRSLVRNVE